MSFINKAISQFTCCIIGALIHVWPFTSFHIFRSESFCTQIVKYNDLKKCYIHSVYWIIQNACKLAETLITHNEQVRQKLRLFSIYHILHIFDKLKYYFSLFSQRNCLSTSPFICLIVAFVMTAMHEFHLKLKVEKRLLNISKLT